MTNYCQGAKAIPLQIALERSNMEIKDVKEIEDLLSVLGIEVAKLVSSRYKYVREIGLDVAIDSNEKSGLLKQIPDLTLNCLNIILIALYILKFIAISSIFALRKPLRESL